MAFSESLAQRIRVALAPNKGIVEKKMFGGIAFLLNGNLLVGVWKDSLIARLGPEDGEKALAEERAKAFDITGKAMKGWVLVEAEGIESDGELQEWVRRAMEFVKGLPRKMSNVSSAATSRGVPRSIYHRQKGSRKAIANEED